MKAFLALVASWFAVVAVGAEPTIKTIPYLGYTDAIEMKLGAVRVVLCPQAGGRVLEYSVKEVNAMYIDEQEKKWQPGRPNPVSAGRFDYGPELVVKPHPKTWGGPWTAKITEAKTVVLTGPSDDGPIQLVREYRLLEYEGNVGLECKQTMRNVSKLTQEVCHWGRSFSPSGGICVIPLGDRPSRFPSKYAMYEEGATINVRNTDENIRERDGCLEIVAPPRKPKLGFDTYAGWLAYALPSNMLFVKRFETFPDRVYNEAAGLTLSVWSPKGPQIELEPIGPRERLEPGKAASFTENWWLLPYEFPKKDGKLDLGSLRMQVLKSTK